MAKTKDAGDILREMADRERAMSDDITKLVTGLPRDEIVRAIEGLRTLPQQGAIASHKLKSDIQRIGEVAKLYERAVRGPLEDFRKIAEGVNAQFRRPEINETALLLQQIAKFDARVFIEPLAAQLSQVQRAMDSMRTPWLEIRDSLQSVRSFAILQGIGAGLAKGPVFDDALTAALRERLGDWRESIAWRAEIFEDIGARSAFYSERGFDSSLTDFPSVAFENAVGLAGLNEPPPVVVVRDHEVPAASDAEERGYRRTNIAHNWLTRFEVHLRRFIAQAMTNACGEKWIKQRVPPNISSEWTRKQQADIASGNNPAPLIDYADFTDYEPIMLRKDNWREVFEPIFRRETFLRESLQRLYPIRLCTMHARLITQDDELFLFVEVKRVLKAIGVLK